MIWYSLSNCNPILTPFILGSCQCTQLVNLPKISLQQTNSRYEKTSRRQCLPIMVWLSLEYYGWMVYAAFLLCTLHSLVSCRLKVHFQNWLAAATLAWHIHYNDLIMMISLMEPLFYYKRVRPILLYYCREEVIKPETKFKYVFCSLYPSLVKTEKSLVMEATHPLFSLSCISSIREHYSIWYVHRESTRGCLPGCWKVYGLWRPISAACRWDSKTRHVTFLPPSLSNRTLKAEEKSHYHQGNKTPVQNYLTFWVVVAWICVP